MHSCIKETIFTCDIAWSLNHLRNTRQCFFVYELYLFIFHSLYTDIVVVLDGGSYIRSFSATVGNLQWENVGTSTHSEKAQLSLLQDSTGNNVDD